MDSVKRALRIAALAGAGVYSAAILFYVFVGSFDLRPYGVKVYVAGLDKPLVWLAAFIIIFLAVTPFPMIRAILADGPASITTSSARRAGAVVMAIAMAISTLALGAYIILGKIAVVTPIGNIRVDNANKPAAYFVLAAMAAFLLLGAGSRGRLLDRAHGLRLHAMTLGLMLIATFAIGEVAVRIAAARLPGARYLVMAGEENKGLVFPNLEAYLAAKPDVKPFMPLLNYYDNSLGMRDAEFATPKPGGRYRILALGDSFTYGMVPYPDSVMTLVEDKLKSQCGGKDVEVLNFGVTGGDLWDYKTINELAADRFGADMVALHFYMGNDGPNLYYHTTELPGEDKRKPVSGSYLLRFLGNLLTVARSVEMDRLKKEWADYPGRGKAQAQCGGCQVTPGLSVTDDAPELTRPYFVPARWIFYISIIEVGSMYVQDEAEARRYWERSFAVLDDIADKVKRSGRRFVLIMYPSSFQIYPERVAEFLEGIKDVDKFRDDLHSPEDAERFKTIRAEFIQPDHPNKMLAEYCHSRKLDCFDATPAILAAAKATDMPLYRARETHWLIRGNHAAAEAEAAYLKGLVCP
jgi:hypothetical protein